MADLDTRSKRASSVQIMAPYIAAPVLPDGTIALLDRPHIAWSYAGITPGTSVPEAAPAFTFPFGQAGYFTWPSAVTCCDARQATWNSGRGGLNIAGRKPSDGSRDKTIRLRKGRLAADDILLTGIIQSTGGIASPITSTITLGDIVVKPHQWTLTKQWPLLHTSGRLPRTTTGDTVSKWSWKLPQYFLTFQGVPYNEGPVLDTETDAITLLISTAGTLAFEEEWFADAVFERFDREAGSTPWCSFRGRYSGELTYTQGTYDHDLSWLLIDAGSVADTPPRGTFTFDSDGEIRTGTALVYELSLSFGKTIGGGVRFNARARVDSTLS